MTGLKKSDWRLIAIGAVAGSLIFPIIHLFRVFAGNMATRVVEYDDEGAEGEVRPVRRAGNIINICIMGAMATTSVRKVLPGTRTQAEPKDAEPIDEHSHRPSYPGKLGRIE